MIMLLFGQPGAGKTTLAEALKNHYGSKSQGARQLLNIDGDRWREVTQNKDYSREGRLRNLKGAFDMALYLEREGFTVILSFVTPYEELRQYLRSRAGTFREVMLLYEGDRGRNGYFVDDFEEPANAILQLNTSQLTLPQCVDQLLPLLD